MKKNYILTLLLTFIVTAFSFGQTTLAAGDIVIIEMQGDAPDGFRFVPLVDLESGTVINFTDNGWLGSSLRSGEGTVIYTASAAVSAGTNIRYSVGDAGDFTTSGGDINIASTGDQILAYQGDAASPTFIFAVAGNSTEWQIGSNDSNQSDLPTGLTDGVNAVAAGAGSGPEDEFDNVYYTGLSSGTKAEILAAVANDTNWTGNNSSSSPIVTNFTITATSQPGLTISSPTEGQVFSAATNVDVVFNVQNFTLAGDNGSGETDGSGNGYIKQTLTTPSGMFDENKFDTNTQSITTIPGASYTIKMELVDNAGASLSPAVIKIVNFSVAFACDLQLGTITTTCNAETTGTDTYNISIAFTGGNTSTYTLTTDSGTIGGENPSTSTTGTITISGINEGTNVVFTAKGDVLNSTCDLTTNISSPTCKTLPIIEPFNYTVGANLSEQTGWEKINTGDDIVIASGNLDYTGLIASTGNKISFDEIGSEAATKFSNTSTGTIYVSFLLKVTAWQTNASPDTTDGGYFAALAGSNSGYDARAWIRPNPDTSGSTYDIGFGTSSSNPPFTPSTYKLNDVVFIVMAYNMDSKEVSIWVNPDSGTFEATPPVATLSTTDTSPPTAINTFILRQDSDKETPFIEIDEVRIATSWATVTPKAAVASVAKQGILGFAAYPNPVNNGRLTITSASTDTKTISIFSVLGKQVLSQKITGTQKQIDVSNINSGIYILKVVEGSKTATKKLVIR